MELWGASLAMQSAIEEFAHKHGTDGRSRGGDKEAEEEEEEGGGGDEADIKSSHLNMAVLKCHGGDQSK